MRRLLFGLLIGSSPLFAQAEVVHVYNWNDYIAPQVLEDFERLTGVHVDYHTYDSTEELEKQLESGAPIDVAVPSHDSLPGLIGAGRLQRLDESLLPNAVHLDRTLQQKLAAYDSGNRYAVPYLWGAAGLAINTQRAEQAFGGPLPNSWSLLFDPEQSGRLSTCGMSVLDAPDETLSVLMSYRGRTLSRSGAHQLGRAAEILGQLRPNLRYVDSERYIEDLKSGELCVAMAWVGDALAAAAAGQPVVFMIPEEGSFSFIDSMVIPAGGRSALAHQFINYILEPKVAALITTETFYPNGNASSRDFIDEALRAQPGLYPDRSTRRRLSMLDPLPEKVAGYRDKVWAHFRDGLPPIGAHELEHFQD